MLVEDQSLGRGGILACNDLVVQVGEAPQRPTPRHQSETDSIENGEDRQFLL